MAKTLYTCDCCKEVKDSGRTVKTYILCTECHYKLVNTGELVFPITKIITLKRIK